MQMGSRVEDDMELGEWPVASTPWGSVVLAGELGMVRVGEWVMHRRMRVEPKWWVEPVRVACCSLSAAVGVVMAMRASLCLCLAWCPGSATASPSVSVSVSVSNSVVVYWCSVACGQDMLMGKVEWGDSRRGQQQGCELAST